MSRQASKFYKSGQIEQIDIDEKNDLEDLERFGRFLGEADWERVCLTAQKSYKSGQIEQINNDEKNIWKIWKDLLDLFAYRLINSSRRSRPEGVCLTAQKFCKSEQIEQY